MIDRDSTLRSVSSSSSPAARRVCAPVECLEGRILFAAGSFGYAFQIGTDPASTTAHNTRINAVTTDKAGNVLVAGAFSGSVDFNPSPRKQFVMGTAGDTDAFVAKYDPAGGFLWVR